jgi:hypothetical protein
MIRFLMFRLGDRDNPDAGVVSRETAEGAVNEYLRQGWKVAHVSTAGATQHGVELVVVLLKNAPESTR